MYFSLQAEICIILHQYGTAKKKSPDRPWSRIEALNDLAWTEDIRALLSARFSRPLETKLRWCAVVIHVFIRYLKAGMMFLYPVNSFPNVKNGRFCELCLAKSGGWDDLRQLARDCRKKKSTVSVVVLPVNSALLAFMQWDRGTSPICSTLLSLSDWSPSDSKHTTVEIALLKKKSHSKLHKSLTCQHCMRVRTIVNMT